VSIGLASKVVLGGMAGAGAAGMLAPEFLFGVSFLSGDPEKINKAADILDEIADAVDKQFQDAHKEAAKVWQGNEGPGTEAFKKFWNEEFGPAVMAVSLKYRSVAGACRAYADVIEKINHALEVLCTILTVDMMYTIGYQVFTWKLFQAIMKRQALLLTFTAKRFVTMLLPTFAYWVADSALYASGEVLLPYAANKLGGIKTDMSGNEVQSLDHNLKTFRENFVANMVFDSVVDGGTALMTLADLSDLRVVGSIDEASIGRVEVGQPVIIRVDAYPDRQLEGEVSRVAPLGVATTNVVTFDVEITITDEDASILRSGMSADLEIVTSKREGVLVVPLAAVHSRGARRFVRLANGEERRIVTGATDGMRLEVLEGVQEGDVLDLAARRPTTAPVRQGGGPFPMGGRRGGRR